MRFLLLAALTLTLCACSMTLSVRGQMQNSEEAFTGIATGYSNGGGVLKIVSTKGSVCEGNFVYVTPRQGEGVFSCDDKRSGPFNFASTGTNGTGVGSLGGERFTFTFGN